MTNSTTLSPPRQFLLNRCTVTLGLGEKRFSNVLQMTCTVMHCSRFFWFARDLKWGRMFCSHICWVRLLAVACHLQFCLPESIAQVSLGNESMIPLTHWTFPCSCRLPLRWFLRILIANVLHVYWTHGDVTTCYFNAHQETELKILHVWLHNHGVWFPQLHI